MVTPRKTLRSGAQHEEVSTKDRLDGWGETDLRFKSSGDLITKNSRQSFKMPLHVSLTWNNGWVET